VGKCGFGGGFGLGVAVVQLWVGLFEFRNEFTSGGSIYCGGDFGKEIIEELSFLELHSFPWRVSDYAIEARVFSREDFWECSLPFHCARVNFGVGDEAVSADDVV